MKEFPTGLIWLVSFVLLLNVVAWGFAANSEVDVNVDFSEQNAKLDALGNEIASLSDEFDALQVSEVVDGMPGEFILSKSEFEDESIEVEALRLAQASVESRDFKKAAWFALVSFGVDIDGYKDITEVRVLNVDVDEGEVEFSVKLYYFLDEDEDETERARLVNFIVVVEDLNFDDGFEDAEVEEDYLNNLEVLKVYN